MKKSGLGKGIHALISYSTVGAVITTNKGRRCVASYTGVGDSNLTLDVGLDITDMALLATIRGATIGSVAYANTSDTVKQILCRNETAGALAAAERAVDVALIKLSAIDRKLILAAGHYNGALGALAVAYGQRGGVVARTGAGVYTITLDQAANQRRYHVIVTVGPGAAGATDLHARVEHTSDTVKTVTIETLVAGADVDADFSWAVFDMWQAPGKDAYAVGSIDGDGSDAAGRGCLPTQNGVGDYRYALDKEAGVGDYVGLATPIGATGHAIRVVNALAARKDIATQVQAAAAVDNCDHGFVALKVQ